MIIVDTNVISEFMRAKPDAAAAAWLDSCERTALWTTTICTMEIRFGIESMPLGRRRTASERAFDVLLDLTFARRILGFDEAASRSAAALQARRQAKGIIVDVEDGMIAGIALSRGAMLATRNIRHFADAGIRLVNPFEPGEKR